MAMTKNLKELDEGELREFVASEGLPAYRAGQITHWIYEKRARDISEITVLSRDLRKSLSKKAYISNLELLDERGSADGARKFLFRLQDGVKIESVLIPDMPEDTDEKERLTLCVSSQAGCAMRCVFCLTGSVGLKRNLRAFEIVDQVISVQRLINPGRVTNVVFMGMGEPLMNLDEVAEAIKRMTGPMGISKRKVTVSTVGIAPAILELARKAPPVNLAVSLNAVTDRVRSRIMPVNKKYPIKELFEALGRYPLPKRSRITFEYVLLKGVNDSPEDASKLSALLRRVPSKVNLIPFNEHEGCEYERPSDDAVLRFQEVLAAKGVSAFIRKSMGADILAACGQLRAGYGDKDKS